MGKFFISGETVRVTFEDGEWCDIKEELSQADMDFISSKMLNAHVLSDGKKPEADVQLNFGKQATLEKMIVSWSFAEDGKPVPVTPENVSLLRMKYRGPLIAKVDQITQEAQAFAKN